MTSSAQIRQNLVDALELDLVGPGPGHPLENERLWEYDPPSHWYLTGFLVPTDAPESQKFDPTSQDIIDGVVGSEEGTGDDDVQPDEGPKRKVFFALLNWRQRPRSAGHQNVIGGSVVGRLPENRNW